jgi:hypothetical protein
MPPIKRRHFLQFAGSTLAVIGLSQLDFLRQADHYGRVLAQSTPRKLALLIGINAYDDTIRPLKGCLTDVELQRQLLLHRFGFQKTDILEVSDIAAIKPTRANILQTFNEHIIQQAKPGDVVVIHFSGHGSRVKDPNPLNTEACRRTEDCDLNGTMVPLDGLPVSQNGAEVVVPDIMGRHLFLLMESIKTDFVTVVLDSCHSGAGTRGNANVRAARARAEANEILVSTPEEREVQEKLRSDLGMQLDDFQTRRQRGIAKGVALGSAQRNQLAADVPFDGFSAGAFTYLLTRYLWQQTTQHSAGTIYTNLSRSTERLARKNNNLTNQIPVFEYEPNNNREQPLYFTNLTSPPAEAVITAVSNQIEFWLGGVAAQNLEGDGTGTVFNLLDQNGQVVGEIEQTSRAGLYGYGKLISGQPDAAQVGRLLREKVIGIPANPALKVGIDPSLGAELAQAKTELATVSRIQVVEVNPSTPMNYLFGRLTEDYQQQLSDDGLTELPPVSSLGLFSPDRSGLLFDTFGRIGEPVVAAISRLRPRFKLLLANQVLGQLLEGGSGSPLQVTATVSAVGDQGRMLHLASRGAIDANASTPVSITPTQFRSKTQLQVKVTNQEEDDLYLSVLVISARGVMNALYPTDWSDPEEAAQIPGAGGERVIDTFQVKGTSGFPELLVLTSRQPLRNALKALQTIADNRGVQRGAIGGIEDDDALNLIDQLLGDVGNLTRSAQAPNGDIVTTVTSGTLPFDNRTLAVLSGVLEVIP